ncbi:hypothetical protein C0991_007646 [Blastosporella zonata]|nr:hypothetical protein C0991_007646 [Blastosporella zonata]
MPSGLTPSNWLQRSVKLPSPTITSRKRSHSPDTSAWARRPAPASNRVDLNIEELQRELSHVRRHIQADVLREAAIIADINGLGSSVPTRETPNEAALRERLKVVEDELRAETRLRLEAEATLTDIQRECREPFLVPAMFDVVETISRLTTQVMDVIQG